MTQQQAAARHGDAWVVSLSSRNRDNWPIAREGGLWGTPNSRGRNVKAGDELYVWQSEEGWRARCIVISDAYPVDAAHPAPWPDDADYKWLFEISVVAEADPPIWLPSPGGWQQATGLHTTTFQSLRTIEPERADAVRALFPVAPSLAVAPPVAAREPSGGWGRGQDRERNKLIEQAGINETIRHFESIGYRLTADRQMDGVGYDLEMSKGGHILKIESKGIAGPELAFNITAKEREVAESDADFRLCAVRTALHAPTVTVLTGEELLRLSVTATQYRVRQDAHLDSFVGERQ